MSDSEQLLILYEALIKEDPMNMDALRYLSVWYLEKRDFKMARKYFGKYSFQYHFLNF